MEYLTTAQAAEELGLKQNTILVYIRRGLIDAEKIGRDYLIKRSEVGRYRNNRNPRGNPEWMGRD